MSDSVVTGLGSVIFISAEAANIRCLAPLIFRAIIVGIVSSNPIWCMVMIIPGHNRIEAD
jgi:hypothetical protein